jgi:Protein of unknown function (DUF2628)
MASYIVMEPALDRRGAAALFVKDAFAPLAVIVPVVWLLWCRLWFEAAMAFFASLILTAAVIWIGAPQFVGIGSILIGIYVALEGGALKIAASRRDGFEDVAVIDARSLTEAEERYYISRPLVQSPAASAKAVPIPSRPLTAAAPAAGLFALPGAH